MSRIKSELQEFLEVPEHRRLYEQERLLVDANELLVMVMNKKGVSRAELAKRLGKSKAFVTQILRGNHNLTLRTLADLFGVLEYRVVVEAQPGRGLPSELPNQEYEEQPDCYNWGTRLQSLAATLTVPRFPSRKTTGVVLPGTIAGELLSQGVAA
jgi:transcriptional regulator with XRE-family HTH domain